MNLQSALRVGLAKVFAYALLALFLIPAVTYVFAGHVQRDQDARFVAGIGQRIDAEKGMAPAEKQARKDYYRSNPPSTICGSADPEAQDYREALCERFSDVWQFDMARKVAFWTLVAGAVLMVAVLGLGALAFADRTLQYTSFVTGWRLTTVASAAALLVQGAMAVWLSFWVTAFFFHKYSPKLVLFVGFVVLAGVLVAVRGIFKRVQSSNQAVGELVSEDDAPLLWKRIRHMAQRLKTDPPRHIVAGIDANFFVTEAPLTVGRQTLTGRTLFVSLPLLRILDQAEADAVFGHELAHLRGGDTHSSARLGPKLVQYDHYRHAMRTGGLTAMASPLLDLYRTIFEIALARDSREREFKADRVAAKLTSPAAIAQSLVKIAAYAQYRYKIEAELFGRNERHDDTTLGIARFVAQGLAPYAASGDFLDAMKTANVPHPFDSHPAMPERLRNVGMALKERDYAAIAVRTPSATWVQEIVTADAIEQRLWSDYEQQFAQDHERSLAYRYEPATDEERALVLRYFPPVVFALKGGHTVEVSIEGIRTSADGTTVFWDAVKALEYKESSFGNALIVTHPEKNALGLGAKTSKIKLADLKKEKDPFNATVGHYWQRHQVMRAQQQGG
ncbi:MULTISPECIES: M48 family metallopeptidase [unclassified Acidovorax]|uniref:M48 family metallopeptidase n=1 Tax=unclassified Acidovorax TaxID=2684926 RepID=UPI001C456D1D|nr:MULTISPECIES: M48 family metallopeptidase [unclassified Acidovorax]MBV7431324.1 M48 family metallopeptidase [Acidovorax sp. sif0732]MBV7452430.1 M48 family metallopeptidase [Acidovorax sp. sif0715]